MIPEIIEFSYSGRLDGDKFRRQPRLSQRTGGPRRESMRRFCADRSEGGNPPHLFIKERGQVVASGREAVQGADHFARRRMPRGQVGGHLKGE